MKRQFSVSGEVALHGSIRCLKFFTKEQISEKLNYGVYFPCYSPDIDNWEVIAVK